MSGRLPPRPPGREGARARALLAAWRATGAEIAPAPHDHGAPGQRDAARSLVPVGGSDGGDGPHRRGEGRLDCGAAHPSA
ncbi:hypothetical protein CQJ94_08630 [Glycomyces fuscus]|nr:hypothetical protein CQJ94_08630 [Glycomyces fuscus]